MSVVADPGLGIRRGGVGDPPARGRMPTLPVELDHDPALVRMFVAANADRLDPVSRDNFGDGSFIVIGHFR